MSKEFERFNEDFLSWQHTARKFGVEDKASRIYYEENGVGELSRYLMKVENYEFIPGLLTHPDWHNFTGDMNSLITYSNEELPEIHDNSILTALRDQLEYQQSLSTSPATVDNLLWNGEAYAVTDVNVNPASLSVAETDYYSKISTTGRLYWELQQALYESDLNGKASPSEIRNWIRDTSLPYRDSHAPTGNSLLKSRKPVRPSLGISCIPIVNDNGTYKIILLRRSQKVSVRPDVYAGVGGGIEPSLGTPKQQLVREIVEEMRGAEEGTDPSTTTFGTKLLNGMENNNGVEITYGGLVIDTLRTKYHIRAYCLITDPDIGNELLNNSSLNFESTEMKTIPVNSPNELLNILQNEEVATTDFLSLIGGLEWVRESHGIETMETQVELID